MIITSSALSSAHTFTRGPGSFQPKTSVLILPLIDLTALNVRQGVFICVLQFLLDAEPFLELEKKIFISNIYNW